MLQVRDVPSPSASLQFLLLTANCGQEYESPGGNRSRVFNRAILSSAVNPHATGLCPSRVGRPPCAQRLRAVHIASPRRVTPQEKASRTGFGTTWGFGHPMGVLEVAPTPRDKGDDRSCVRLP